MGLFANLGKKIISTVEEAVEVIKMHIINIGEKLEPRIIGGGRSVTKEEQEREKEVKARNLYFQQRYAKYLCVVVGLFYVMKQLPVLTGRSRLKTFYAAQNELDTLRVAAASAGIPSLEPYIAHLIPGTCDVSVSRVKIRAGVEPEVHETELRSKFKRLSTVQDRNSNAITLSAPQPSTSYKVAVHSTGIQITAVVDLFSNLSFSPIRPYNDGNMQSAHGTWLFPGAEKSPFREGSWTYEPWHLEEDFKEGFEEARKILSSATGKPITAKIIVQDTVIVVV